jgi:penicillin amidase
MQLIRVLGPSRVARFSVCLLWLAAPPGAGGDPVVPLAGLKQPAKITRDSRGVAHVQAANEHDLFFLQGYVHAQDRLFQMDAARRQASGTLAELLGPAALETDVLLRTIGLRRAAERSWSVTPPHGRAVLQAYADGVNAAIGSHPLPPEYGALELTAVAPWDPMDSLAVAKLIAFSLSFELDIDNTVTLLTYVEAGSLLGFDGAALYTEDLARFAPFDAVPTIKAQPVSPQALSAQAVGPRTDWARDVASRAAYLHPRLLESGRGVERTLKASSWPVPLGGRERPLGSNEWVFAGWRTDGGAPLHASDPHLALGTPSTFYPVHLRRGDFDVIGDSFPGVPAVILGHNRFIAWSATNNPLDVTDVYQEQVVPDAASPSGLSTVHQGVLEHVIPIPEEYRANAFDGVPDNVAVVPPGGAIPPATLIVPRRNQGPIVSLDVEAGSALSVQYAGFSGTREIECFLAFDAARDLDEFVQGMQLDDIGSQNFAYSDVHGRIAVFSSAEAPVREDLQQVTVEGLPPFFIRNGTGGNEWLALEHPQPGQALPYEILRFDEMPQAVDPPEGWFQNANNDPAGITFDNDPLNQLRPGGGLLYLNYSYDSGIRAARIDARIQELLAIDGAVSVDAMQALQADTVDRTAEVFVPHLLRAFDRAQEPGADPLLQSFGADAAVVEAVGRLRDWDHTAPTGIPEGYDASDHDGVLGPPSHSEVARSVAATIYAVWRGRTLERIVDAPLDLLGLPPAPRRQRALRHLLDGFDARGGVGASGVDFFVVPGVASAEDRRDVLLLQSLRDALDLLAGPAFEPAFGGSVRQDDWRWRRLHRLTLAHPLGAPFSTPPAAGAWPAPLAGLDGIPVDGGYSIDAAFYDERAADSDSFRFDWGPSRRFVSEARKGGVRSWSSTPGGTSGVPGTPFAINLLPGWLTNDALPQLFDPAALKQDGGVTTHYKPVH